MIDEKAIAEKLAKAPRLRKLFDFLRGRGYAGATTREIIAAADVCAVNSAVDELRSKGFSIDCQRERTTDEGAAVYRYVLVVDAGPPQGQLFR